MRLALLISVALLATACSGYPATGARDRFSPHSDGPPSASLETRAGKSRLGLSSYCWKFPGRARVCQPAIPPKCGRPAQWVENVAVERGETVRADLGYAPDVASVEGAQAKLDSRTVTWRVEHGGAFRLFTKGQKGEASYVGCAVLR